MQKAIRAILAVSSRVLLIGLTIQMGLGLVWMAANLGSLQGFEKTSFGALIGEGVLLGIWQVIQVLIAFCAVYRLLQKLRPMRRAWATWGSLAVLTVPMAMQCHMAVLPNSLASSFFLLELAGAVACLRNKEPLDARALLHILPFWLLSALLLPEYLLFGAIPVVVVFCKSDKVHTARNALLILAFWGMIVGCNQFIERTEEQPNLAEAMASRMAWPTLQQDYFDWWTEDMRAKVDFSILQESAHYAQNMQQVFVPAVKEVLGEDADAFLGQVAGLAWEGHSRKILHQIIWDGLGYTASPTVHHLMLQRRGYDSYSGRNYDIMLEHAPMITKYYVNYSGWWFAVGLLLTCLMQILVVWQQGLRPWLRKNRLWILTCVLSGGALVVWYTMQGAGMFDYKNSIGLTMLWLVWMAVTAIGNIEDKAYGREDEEQTA